MAFSKSRGGDSHFSDDELRRRLFSSLLAEDWDTALALLEQHQTRVRALFASWSAVPAAIRDDRRAVDEHVHAVVTIAHVFAQAGDDSLLRQLTAPGGDNPMQRLQDAFVRGQQAAEEERFSEAIEVLEPLVAELRTMQGSFVDQCLSRACGTLGIAMFRTGRRDEALRWTQDAIDASSAVGDAAGVETYRQNLQFIRNWHSGSSAEEDIAEWDDVPPEELERLHGVVDSREDLEHLFSPRAAAKARRYAHLAGRGYDEIAYCLRAAAPATGGIHFQTAAEIASRLSARRSEKVVWPRIGDSHPILIRRVFEPGEPRDRVPETGRYTFQILSRTTFDPAKRARLERGEQLLDLGAAPEMFASLAIDHDADPLLSQSIEAHAPGMHWVPFPLLVSAGRFAPLQQWRGQLATQTKAGAYYAFVSHRWLAADEPDPDGMQAAVLAWQLLAHVCDAVRVARIRGLHAPRRAVRTWTVPYGPAGSSLAESLLVNLLRPNVDAEALKALHAEIEPILSVVADYGIRAALEDQGLERLRLIVRNRPALGALLENLFLWYDYSCLPQPPLSSEDAKLLRNGLEFLEAYQRIGRTVVLLDDPLDYLSRAWCTFEALVAGFESELLAGSRRAAAAAPDARGLEEVLTHRRHLVWRGILDTEVFGIQSPHACMERLGVAATNADDLPFLYGKYRLLGAPSSMISDASEIVTGTFPLPLSDGAVLLSLIDHPPEHQQEPHTTSLDWTEIGEVGTWSSGESAHYPAFVELDPGSDDPRNFHIHIVASCEGEAILFSRFVMQHLGDAESLMQGRARSLSWLASDIAAIGHMQEGSLWARAVDARRWLIVAMHGRLAECKSTHRIINALTPAGVEVTTIAADEDRENVTFGVRATSAGELRRIAWNGVREHAGGPYRDSIPRHLL